MCCCTWSPQYRPGSDLVVVQYRTWTLICHRINGVHNWMISFIALIYSISRPCAMHQTSVLFSVGVPYIHASKHVWRMSISLSTKISMMFKYLFLLIIYEHIETKTRWSPFYRRHFQHNFLHEFAWILVKNFTKGCSLVSNWYSSIR